ncbi:MAG: ABC transporter permease [Bacteroidota bacterium]
MIQNFFKIAWRNLWRQKGYTALNLLGLVIGISSTLIILLYLSNELSYDAYHSKADRIYRVSSNITEPDNAFKWAVTQIPLGPALAQDYPEVEAFVRFVGNGRTRFEVEDKQFFEQNVFFVDSTVFDVFTFELLAGSAETAMDAPNRIALNQSLAEKMFGSVEAALDQNLDIGREDPLQVAVVYKDLPSNVHIRPQAMISANTLPARARQGSWGSFGIYTYVLLNEGSSGLAFEGKLPEIIEKHVATIFASLGITVEYKLLNIKDIHLKSTFEGEPEPTGTMSYIVIFGLVAAFMLLIACINYMNLATARSAKRAKEVGIRKVAGSWRRHLIGQFLAESLLIAFVAMLISVAATAAFIPVINTWLDASLTVATLWQTSLIWVLVGVFLVVGFLSGSYPAFFLSSLQPVTVLKGSFKAGKGTVNLRKVLVVVQFSLGLMLLICTGVVYDQLQFMQDKDMGFTREPVLRFALDNRNLREKWPVLKAELEQLPGVNSMGTATSTPGAGFNKILFNLESNEGVMDQKGVDHYRVDFEYMPTMDIPIVQGRNFESGRGTDSTAAVLVNEAMVQRMGWEDPIGKRVQFGLEDTLPYSYVIGVVRDFHQRSLHHLIEPLMFIPRGNNRFVHLKLDRDRVADTRAEIASAWTELFPTTPFEPEYVEESFQEQYESEQKRSKIFSLFALLTIIIGCLGLLGLASYTAQLRTKEVGVRKIMGASVTQILVLMTKEFSILVGLSVVFAFPISWYLMKNWLTEFAYAVDLSFWTFGGAFFLTLLLSFLTTSYHALKVARANPSKALRYE